MVSYATFPNFSFPSANKSFPTYFIPSHADFAIGFNNGAASEAKKPNIGIVFNLFYIKYFYFY